MTANNSNYTKNNNYKNSKNANKVKIKRELIIVAVVAALLLANRIFFPDSGETIEVENHISVGSNQAQGDVIRNTDIYPQGFDYSEIPPYSGKTYYTVNDGKPFFTEEEIETARQGTYEYYGNLDNLGRCTPAMACLGRNTMPAQNEQRGDISKIHPTGWKQARYDCVDSETVFTRAHLIAWMLSAENDNEKNLISGTRYMNSDGMTYYEKKAKYYIQDHSGATVLYRTTPIFEGNDLMAKGVLMEIKSINNAGGNNLNYCAFIYNVQPGLDFNYSNGSSWYTGIFYDIDQDSVYTDGIDLQNFVMCNGTVHKKGCSNIDGRYVPFYGDKTMVSKWPSLGYSVCSCCK